MLIKLILLLGHDLHTTIFNGHSFDLVVSDLASVFVTSVLPLFRAILYLTCGTGAFLGFFFSPPPGVSPVPLVGPSAGASPFSLNPLFLVSFLCELTSPF